MITDSVRRMIEARLREVQPYRAIVTAVDADGVSFRVIEGATGGDERYARIAGPTLAVADVIMVIGRRNPIVLGKVSKVAEPAGVTDHTLLTNIGTNAHATIDAFIAD